MDVTSIPSRNGGLQAADYEPVSYRKRRFLRGLPMAKLMAVPGRLLPLRSAHKPRELSEPAGFFVSGANRVGER